MTDFPAYEHSVLDVCQRLHGHACGSGDTLPEHELHKLREWLRLRITEHWRAPAGERCARYDNLVRRLAMAALDETKEDA